MSVLLSRRRVFGSYDPDHDEHCKGAPPLLAGRFGLHKRKGRGKVTIVRSDECKAVLARYGLAECAMIIIGADKWPNPPTWGVTVTCEAGRTEFLDVRQAGSLASDLRQIREDRLAERFASAVEAAKRQMRPRE